MDLSARARAVAEGLQSGGVCCPLCLSDISKDWLSNMAALEDSRLRMHEFWSGCMAAITDTGSTADERRRNLHRALSVCPQHGGAASDEATDVLCVFICAACSCLNVVLSIGAASAIIRGIRSKRAIVNKAGRWPQSRSHLFPRGEKAGVITLMEWSVRLGMPSPLTLLADMLHIAHPLVLAEILLSGPLHKELVIAIVHRIADYVHWQDGTVPPWGDQPPSPLSPQHRTENMQAAIELLSNIHHGSDALPHSFLFFASGFEAPLFTFLQHLRAALKGDDPSRWLASILSTALFPVIPTSQQSLYPEVASWIPSYDGFQLFRVIHETLRGLALARRFCSRCWSSAHAPDAVSTDTEEAFFRACERCRIARYCGRDCQLADWKDGEPVRHRAVCPLLVRIRTATHPDMDPAQFEAATATLNFNLEELRTLSLFTLNSKAVYFPLLFRAADVHRDLWGDEQHPPATVKALAHVDTFKKMIADKRSERHND